MGRLVSFLFIWRFRSARHSIASGSVGCHIAVFLAGVNMCQSAEHGVCIFRWRERCVSWGDARTLVIVAILFTAFLLYRRITVIGQLLVLWLE